MPSLGADMEHGKVVEWLVKPGDYVHRGDLVAEVDTEKTVMEIESFEDGVIAEYLVDLGETVPVGTPIARMTGTPADVPVEPAASGEDGAEPTDGTVGTPAIAPPIRHLAHQLGVEVEGLHGTGRHGSVTRADVEAAAAAIARDAGPEPPPVEPVAATAPGRASRVRSSPRARRLAAELGIDLGAVVGSGPGGAVTEADLHREAGTRGAADASLPPASASAETPSAGAPSAGAPSQAERGRRRPGGSGTDRASAARADAGATSAAERTASLRRAIGSLMARSKREIPHYYLSTTIDLGRALDWMREANAGRPLAERLVPAALLLAASARAARDVPEMNGFLVEGEFRQSPEVHLGVAVALRGGGLVAPAIHDADRLHPDEVMAALRDLVARARAGRLRRAEMTDPTITVTNLGELGVESVFGVIYAPQVALVGFGRVVERPWAEGGLLGVRPVVTATLSADHRVSDGLQGGRFLARIDELLQKPEDL